MSSQDPNSATETVLPFVAELPIRNASDTSSSPATNTKDEIDSQALCLLREFFLVLDQWDQQQEPREGEAT